MIVVIHLGGVGKRFSDLGYKDPKPLIKVLGKEIIFWVVDNLKLNSIKIIDVRRESEYTNKHIEGANNIPLSLLSNELKNISDTQDNYYIHCAGGYRSVIAV